MRKLSTLALVLILLLAIGISMYEFLMGSKVVRVRVTTTTSLYATGLLDYLAGEFTKRYDNVALDFIPVGSGEAPR